MTVVDIHCHNFNGADLPVQGFVQTVVAERYWLARFIDRAAERKIQRDAIGRAEIVRLEELLNELDDGATIEALDAASATLPDIGSEASVLLAELRETESELFAAAQAEAEAAAAWTTSNFAFDSEGMGDLLRGMEFVALLTKPRLELTRLLVARYPGVALFSPMLVDFYGLDGDSPVTTVMEQVKLQDLISQLAMRGFFGQEKHILPFVGFHPLRPDGFDAVQLAVEDHGFVGVKIYPPIGFRPIDNVGRSPWMSPGDAELADDNLAELYEYCVRNAVPITTHGNRSNWAHKKFMDLAAPAEWKRVLDRWPDLRLNIGHFGWAGRHWPDQLVDLMTTRDHLYVDIANFENDDLFPTLDKIEALLLKHPELVSRLMYGSDWFMAVLNAGYVELFDALTTQLHERFKDEYSDIMGRNALRFLGLLGEEDNANLKRVRRRYEAAGSESPW